MEMQRKITSIDSKKVRHVEVSVETNEQYILNEQILDEMRLKEDKNEFQKIVFNIMDKIEQGERLQTTDNGKYEKSFFLTKAEEIIVAMKKITDILEKMGCPFTPSVNDNALILKNEQEKNQTEVTKNFSCKKCVTVSFVKLEKVVPLSKNEQERMQSAVTKNISFKKYVCVSFVYVEKVVPLSKSQRKQIEVVKNISCKKHICVSFVDIEKFVRLSM
ncbi:hypothetical protein HELRODRAFT_164891 [Helobdella robusta]|uniref:Uncharacterized protein n=1 Tax=Helobdella robusta TaxID=6412 RepID=T1EVX5_HELRO|nr:hypothetical protein HELRODRAFT_164891 [Helobdella robusta]ESN92778.1 hypothetical protein HELRODRAFT_164891 [Helobdella robusta]